MEKLISNVSLILIAVAVICTLVSIITQYTKEWGFLNKIPTSLQVLILSIGFTVISFLAFMSYKNYKIEWYMIISIIIAGIFISYITIKGWDSLISLFKRFYKKSDDLKK